MPEDPFGSQNGPGLTPEALKVPKIIQKSRCGFEQFFGTSQRMEKVSQEMVWKVAVPGPVGSGRVKFIGRVSLNRLFSVTLPMNFAVGKPRNAPGPPRCKIHREGPTK